MKLINRKYEIIYKIGNGNFGQVFKGYNKRSKEEVAIKLAPVDNEASFLLKNETIYYNYLKGCDNIPILKWFGKDDKNYYLVLELFDESLLDFRKSIIEAREDMCFFKIANKLFLIVKSIHDKGLIHRDIKPDNFLFNRQQNKFVIIDFGFCVSYLNNNSHNICEDVNSFLGSLDYASINCHKLKSQSRRDDLESICYVIYYLMIGYLPWSGKSADEILIMKENFIDICKIPQLISLWINITQLKFNENPKYLLYTEILNNNY
jgi:serine/threonine protein kinase